MILLSDYLSNLVYDSVKVYSYNRGEAYDKYLQEMKNEKLVLKEQMDAEPNWDIQIKLSKRIKKIKKYDSLRDIISDINGQLHPTSEMLKEIKKQDLHFDKLKRILNKEINNPIASRCIEELRDGILFFQNGKYLKSLSVCFSCVSIKDSVNQTIYADRRFYKEYKEFLFEIGHDTHER